SLSSFLRAHPPLSPTFFPYTTLFRSHPHAILSRILNNGKTLLRHRWHPRAGRNPPHHPRVHAQVGLGGWHRLPQQWPLSRGDRQDRKSTRLNSSHVKTSYAVFCLKKR